MFKKIHHISDIQPFVSDKKEIRFSNQSNGMTIGCYMFSDSKTFDSVEALECRGIAFDEKGYLVSRPLHKFFNIGEKEWLSPDKLLLRDDIVRIYEKLDGSMIATAWVNNRLLLRSKKAFNSDVVKLAEELIELPENENIKNFSWMIARCGMTAIFELLHPEARIVVGYKKPELRLLHVRHNVTGKYLMLENFNCVHSLIKIYKIPTVKKFDLPLSDLYGKLESLKDCEGYVIQFKNGDMVKIKCPWYLRLHRSITFLRERDIALLAINEELDDIKNSLVEIDIDLNSVLDVESRLKNILISVFDEVESAYDKNKSLQRKEFAIATKENPLFSLIMNRYLGKDIELKEWYVKKRLKQDFGLRVLANSAIADAINE